jgi:hypothetical protein
MRINYNRTTEETKTLGKKNRKPLDVNDLLIETRLFGSNVRARIHSASTISYHFYQWSRLDEFNKLRTWHTTATRKR